MARRITRGDVHGRLRASLRTREPRLVRIVASLRGDLRNAYSYAEIAAALRSGNLSPELLEAWRQDYSAFVSKRLAPEWQRQIANAGKSMATDISAAAGEPFRYLPNAGPITEWIEQRSAERVVSWTQLQHEAAQKIIGNAMTEGVGADELGIRLRAVTGLTPMQAEAVDKMRAALVADGMDATKAGKQAQRYADMLHRQRALRIARTELASAYNQGQDSAVRQAIGDGMFDGPVMKEFSAAEDERMCEVCGALDGQTVGMDEEFSDGAGVPPIHPSCRCTVLYVVS